MTFGACFGILVCLSGCTDKIYFQNVELHRIKTEQFAKAVQEVESKFM